MKREAVGAQGYEASRKIPTDSPSAPPAAEMRDVCEAPGSDGGGMGPLRGLTGCRWTWQGGELCKCPEHCLHVGKAVKQTRVLMIKVAA